MRTEYTFAGKHLECALKIPLQTLVVGFHIKEKSPVHRKDRPGIFPLLYESQRGDAIPYVSSSWSQ